MNNKLKSVELFVALGLATTIGVSNVSIINAEEISEIPATPQLLAQDTEGGEGGEGGGELSPGEQANADFQDRLGSAGRTNEKQRHALVDSRTRKRNKYSNCRTRRYF